MIDVSLGFNSPDVSGVPWGPAFMAPIAQRIKAETALPTAVGWFIKEPQQAEDIIAQGQADPVMLARKEQLSVCRSSQTQWRLRMSQLETALVWPAEGPADFPTFHAMPSQPSASQARLSLSAASSSLPGGAAK